MFVHLTLTSSSIGTSAANSSRERGVEIRAAFDSSGVDPLSTGERAEIQMRQLHPRQRLNAEVAPNSSSAR